MEVGLFSLIMCLGLLTARAEAIADKLEIQSSNILIKALNFGSMISTFSMIVWGFIQLDWWVPIYTFGLFYLAASLIINQKRLALFLTILPFFSVVTIAVTTYLWVFTLFLSVA